MLRALSCSALLGSAAVAAVACPSDSALRAAGVFAKPLPLTATALFSVGASSSTPAPGSTRSSSPAKASMLNVVAFV